MIVARPGALKRRFAVVALLYVTGAAAVGVLLPFSQLQFIWWEIGVGTAVFFQLGMLWRFLPFNRRPAGGQVLPTLGLGNGLSLLRGLLLAMLAGFLLVPEPFGWVAWVPVVLYTTADLLDFFDGLAARLTNHVTQLGEKLDIELDSLGIGIVVLLVILHGKAGWWFAIVALARYLFVVGLWWREKNGQPVYELTDSRFRRLLAGYNMGFLSVALWPIMTRAAVAIGAAAFVTPLLLLFWRDWLVASGRLNPADATYQAWRDRLLRWVSGRVPLVLRLLIAVTAFSSGLVSPGGPANLSWATVLRAWGWPADAAATALFVLNVTALVSLTAVVVGVWARWLALVALIPIALEVIGRGISWSSWDLVLLGAAVCLVAILNSGRFSLVSPNDWYMYRRLGETSDE